VYILKGTVVGHRVKIHTDGFVFWQDNIQGIEFSGRDQRGYRVMGITAAQAIASMVLADTKILWKVPDHWTLEDAATVPVVYTTVS
jgi:fatty acid synthase